jgi:hypothetical protein
MTPADIARVRGRSVADILGDENEIFRVYFESTLMDGRLSINLRDFSS